MTKIDTPKYGEIIKAIASNMKFIAPIIAEDK